MVLSLSPKGLTTDEASGSLGRGLRSVDSKNTISAITDRVLGEIVEWQSRPLDAIYPVVSIKAIFVKTGDGQCMGVLPRCQGRTLRVVALNPSGSDRTQGGFGRNARGGPGGYLGREARGRAATHTGARRPNDAAPSNGSYVVRFWDVLAGATARNLPSDPAAKYYVDRFATGSPGSSGSFIDSSVDPDRLADLVADLEVRGCAILRDQPGAR